VVYQAVLEPIRNDSAVEVHHNYEQITKVTWYQTKSGQTLQSKHSAQQRNYKTNLHSKKKANAMCVTDNRICKTVMKLLAIPLCPTSVLQYCSKVIQLTFVYSYLQQCDSTRHSDR